MDLPPPLRSPAQKATIPIHDAVPPAPDPLPSLPVRHRRARTEDLRPGSQQPKPTTVRSSRTTIRDTGRRRPRPRSGSRSRSSPPNKRTQPRRVDLEILLPGVIRHVAREDPPHRDERRRMRADEDRLAGEPLRRIGGQRRLEGVDLGVDVGYDARECGGDAVVQLGDGLAAGGGDEERGVVPLGIGVEDGGEVGAEGVGGGRGGVVEEGGCAEPFSRVFYCKESVSVPDLQESCLPLDSSWNKRYILTPTHSQPSHPNQPHHPHHSRQPPSSASSAPPQPAVSSADTDRTDCSTPGTAWVRTPDWPGARRARPTGARRGRSGSGRPGCPSGWGTGRGSGPS